MAPIPLASVARLTARLTARLCRSTGGSAIVEAALAAPVILILTMGSVETARFVCLTSAFVGQIEVYL
jgi:Flp pilus assembly protein TadG